MIIRDDLASVPDHRRPRHLVRSGTWWRCPSGLPPALPVQALSPSAVEMRGKNNGGKKIFLNMTVLPPSGRVVYLGFGQNRDVGSGRLPWKCGLCKDTKFIIIAISKNCGRSLRFEWLLLVEHIVSQQNNRAKQELHKLSCPRYKIPLGTVIASMILSTSCWMVTSRTYTVKKASEFPVLSHDVTNQTLPGRE